MSASCARCRFWDTSIQLQTAPAGTTGLCRCRAPLPGFGSDIALTSAIPQFKSGWPFVANTDWCGEFVRGGNAQGT